MAKRIIKSLALGVALVFFFNAEFFGKHIQYAFRNAGRENGKLVELENEKSFNPDYLIIESLLIEAPIQYVDLAAEEIFQEALQKGVVHYPGTALPGEVGNVYLFGHSSDNPWAKGDYKAVFAVLPRIEKGAKIIVTDEQGRAFEYFVTDQFVVSVKDTSVLEQNTDGKRILTLQTSYPIGTSLKRYIVRAELVN